MAINNCPRCGAELIEGARFCSKCRCEINAGNQQIEMSGYCGKCGAPLIKGAKFCSKCRAPVEGNAADISQAANKAAEVMDGFTQAPASVGELGFAMPQLPELTGSIQNAAGVFKKASALPAILSGLTGGEVAAVGEESEYEPADSGALNIEVDTSASDSTGEDGGVVIDSDIVTGDNNTAKAIAGGAAIGGALGGVVAALNSQKKKKEDKNGSTYKMHVFKEFGDTLIPGQKYFVYARIVEYDSSGKAKRRDDLSQMIGIYADDGIQVNPADFTAPYAAAQIEVFDARSKHDAVVSFKFNGKGGSFTQHMHFKIDEPRIVFYQQSFTAPALYDKTVSLPFRVIGLNKGYTMKAELVPELSANDVHDYELDITDADVTAAMTAKYPEVTDIHFVQFLEINKKPCPAGFTTSYRLRVTAADDKMTVTNEMAVSRMYRGLMVNTQAINCCRVVKPESRTKNILQLHVGDFQTAITESTAYVVEFDDESNTVRQFAAFPTLEITPIKRDTEGMAEEQLSLQNEYTQRIQKAIDSVDIKLGYKSFTPEASQLVYYCKGGYLDPPTRYIVNCKWKCTVKGVEYEYESHVLLRSQLKRTKAQRAASATVEYDQRVEHFLYRFKSYIGRNYFNNLFPVYLMIVRMLDGYDYHYGYDNYQVAKIYDIRERLRNGEIVGANCDPIGYGVVDELEALAAAASGMDNWQGIVMRMSLAYMTGGISELVLLPMDVNKGIMDYRTQVGENGTAIAAVNGVPDTHVISVVTVEKCAQLEGKTVTGYIDELALKFKDLNSKLEYAPDSVCRTFSDTGTYAVGTYNLVGTMKDEE